MAERPWENEKLRETDARFPSGRWVGYWHQGERQGRMQLDINFHSGRLFGDGRDFVGDFVLSGSYDTQTGRVQMHKAYLGQHEVIYDGVGTTDGIRGAWHIRDPEDGRVQSTGPFHIWPIGPGDSQSLETAVAEPLFGEV